MKTRTFENCKSQGLVVPVRAFQSDTVFWCKHQDECTSKKSWGTNGERYCLQSPIYGKPKVEAKE